MIIERAKENDYIKCNSLLLRDLSKLANCLKTKKLKLYSTQSADNQSPEIPLHKYGPEKQRKKLSTLFKFIEEEVFTTIHQYPTLTI